MVGRTIGDIGKAPKSCFYTIRGANKNKSWVLKILMFQHVKIQFHILKLIKMEMISWPIYMILKLAMFNV
jgi:hypothetical protein